MKDKAQMDTEVMLHGCSCKNQAVGRGSLKVPGISQGSVVTCLGCGGILGDDFVTNLLLSLPLKEFGQSTGIWGSYGQEYSYDSLSSTHFDMFHLVTWSPGGMQSVCLSVCLLLTYLKKPHGFFCTYLLPMLGPPLMTMQYIVVTIAIAI